MPKQTGLKVANVHLETIGATEANKEKEERQREVCSFGLNCSRRFADVMFSLPVFSNVNVSSETTSTTFFILVQAVVETCPV